MLNFFLQSGQAGENGKTGAHLLAKCRDLKKTQKCKMKIGIGQINARVGDFSANAEKILNAARSFAEGGADFAVFPECAVSGCPVGDLIFYSGFVRRAEEALSDIAAKLPLPAVVGCPRAAEGPIGFRNSAFWIEGGRVKAVYDKHLLPNYGALNEARVFDPGRDFCVVDFKGKKIGLSICEDIWTLPFVPTASRYELFSKPLDYYSSLNSGGKRGLDMLVNLSASVFSSENDNVRSRGALLPSASAKLGAPLVWCNLVGGNDNLVFAGGSGVFDSSQQTGEKSICLEKFAEDCRVVDACAISGFDGDFHDFRGDDDLRRAIVMSLRDFVSKCGMGKVAIGLSGGIDSALVAALAVEALGPDKVIGVSMPSKISSRHSRDDARSLAENLGLEFHTVPIEKIVDAAESSLSGIFSGLPPDVTEENIQARARGLVMMAISNKFGALVLTTGNKSECSVGYCTLYGDTCGAFAPICDLYKTQVYSISRLINEQAGRDIIPQNTIDKPPSAELRPNQTDQDTLPPYDLFDAVLREHIENFKSVSEINSASADIVEGVAKMVSRAEYKRRQYPMGPKLSAVAYSSDRKAPVASCFNGK